jgi:hypothetical protein
MIGICDAFANRAFAEPQPRASALHVVGNLMGDLLLDAKLLEHVALRRVRLDSVVAAIAFSTSLRRDSVKSASI